MKQWKTRVVLSCATLGVAAFTMIASAQEHPGDACKDQATMEACHHEHMAKSAAEHIAKLHDDLKITPNQEAAFKTFTDTMRQQREEMAQHEKPDHAAMENMPLPDRLEQHLAMEQKHLTAMQAHLSNLKTFYAVLTPEQKIVMDKHIKQFLHQQHQHQHHMDKH